MSLGLRSRRIRDLPELASKNISALIRRYLNYRFDRKHSIETSGIVPVQSFTCASSNREHALWYEPTPVRVLRFAFSQLPEDLSSYTFVDFGSGKGRTIIYALRYCFKRIIGVEFAEELHRIAERNLRTYRGPWRCAQISSINVDASEFQMPEGDLVLYFFHPFRAEVMKRVLANIERSYLDAPRSFLVLYYHPQLSEMFDNLSFLRRRASVAPPRDLSAEPCVYRRKLEIYEAFSGLSQR
jgi:SAM-dependent methyltransferase